MAGMVSTQIKDTLKFPNCVAMAALPFCRLVLVWVDCVYHFHEFAPSSDGAPVNATAAHGAATFFCADIILPQEAAPSHQTCSNPQAGP